jgi:hypothetical protein
MSGSLKSVARFARFISLIGSVLSTEVLGYYPSACADDPIAVLT